MVVPTRTVSVAAVNDYELIVVGLSRLLSQFPDQLEVRERIVLGRTPLRNPVDVALYDTYGRVGIDDALRELVEHELIGAVAMFTLDLNERIVADARRAGAAGYISKALPARAIADAIVAVAHGETVMAGTPSPSPALDALDWPGKTDGLSERESQVLVLAAQGLTNREIAAALYLSPETIKGYLSQVFSKLGFRNRVQASSYVHRSSEFTRLEPDGGQMTAARAHMR